MIKWCHKLSSISWGWNPSLIWLHFAQAKTEIWNGTNWTEDGDLNTARSHSAGGGTTSAAVIANGSTDPGLSQATEEWTGAGAAQTRTFTDS